MTRQLSPTAQTVLDAATKGFWKSPFDPEGKGAAAALRVAVDLVVPPSLEAEFYNRNPSLTLQKAVEIRSELLAIANELEA